MGIKFLPFRIDPFSEGRENDFDGKKNIYPDTLESLYKTLHYIILYPTKNV